MKKISLIILLSIGFSSDYSDRYYESMDKGIKMFESSKTEEDLLRTSNYFYRISQVMRTDWLSSYYYSLCNTKIILTKN